jgi:protein farnesyltransferase subunit beta
MHNFLLSLKDSEHKGAIRMEPHGERDMRSIYCAVSVAKILNILSKDLEEDVAKYILKSQTYEGGFGGLKH